MRMAASSPVWFTRRAEERNFCCSVESGRIGLPSFCFWSEGCDCAVDCEGGGWGADMVLEKRDVWRAHAVLGAKWRMGYWMLRGMPQDSERGESKEDGMITVRLLYK
jgi:hypothetical protein